MAMLAQLYDNGRAAERHALDADATLRGEDQVPVDILVADLSATGCLFVCVEEFAPDAEITIGIAGVGRRQAKIVRVMGSRYGCEFVTALTDLEIGTARTAPGGTIVDFPAWSGAVASDEIDLRDTAKLSGGIRLALLAGVTVIGWSVVIAAFAWLR